VLPRGATYLAAPVVLGKNIGIKGKGLRFASQVIPLASFSGAALFNISGGAVIGGWSFYCYFKDFIVDESLVNSTAVPIIFRLHTAYSCTFEDVYVRSAVGKIFELTSCNDINIIRPRLFGFGTTQCTHGIHAVSASSVTITNPDLELMGVGIQQDTNCTVTVQGGYGERNTRGWLNNGNSSGSMTVTGGLWQGVNAGTIAAEARGGNCTVTGGRYTANGGSGLSVGLTGNKPINVHFTGVSGNITDAKNWATTNSNSDPTGVHRTVLRHYKTAIADNVAITIFRVVCPNSTANFGYVDVDIYAKLTNVGFSIWTARYRIAFAVASSAIQVTSVVEYAKVNANLSGNYALAVTVTAVNSIPNLDIQITCNSSGALGEGTESTIMAEATLVQTTDTGAVYLITQ